MSSAIPDQFWIRTRVPLEFGGEAVEADGGGVEVIAGESNGGHLCGAVFRPVEI